MELSADDYRAIITGIARMEESLHGLAVRVKELKDDHERNSAAHWRTINETRDDVGEIKQRMVAIEERSKAAQKHAFKIGGGAGAAAGGVISFVVDLLVRAMGAK